MSLTAQHAVDEHLSTVVQNEDTPPNEASLSVVPSQDKGKAMDHNIQDEMIPEELLFALTQSDVTGSLENKEQLAPLKKTRTPEKLRMALKRGPPANVWHHKGRRTQFRHLTDNPRSLGKGVGTRDISFLYDVTTHQKPTPPQPSKMDKSAVRLEAAQHAGKVVASGSQLAVPDSIIPEEYHIIKSKAVLGLEYVDESLTTKITDHDQLLRLFPSLQPTKRFEVVQLLRTMDALLEKSGVDDEETEIKGPSQIHNLLGLIKKEQNIYDLVFCEVIRQVSVECIERGQLLSRIRQKYADLLNRVPRQVKSLHAEVMAQRSLDRRLTEELLRFKSSISFLTTELQNVREHDEHVTNEAAVAEEELAKALKESQTNANLVDEYHDLYEMQRRRLEESVKLLTEEKDLWSSAAYSLSLKIMSANTLNTAKRLHVSEKAWSKLANHFAVMLSDRDSENLASMQKHVSQWRNLMFHFNQKLHTADGKTTETLETVRTGLEKWTKIFEETLAASMSDVRSVKGPPQENIKKLYDEVKIWEELLGADAERFGGDMLLSNQEQLQSMARESNQWTEVALEVYRRHKVNGENFPLAETMIELNETLRDVLKQLDIRTTGENGVARGMISLQNNLGNWVNKLIMMVHGSETFSDTEWLHLYDKLGEYKGVVEDALQCVGSQQRDEDRQNHLPHKRIEVEDTMKQVQNWMKSSLDQIEAENGKMGAQVNSIHTKMVLWMVQVLLHLAPNHHSITGSTPNEASMSTSCTVEELEKQAVDISDHMSHFTSYLCQCSSAIVESAWQEKKDQGEDDADHEYRDFLRVKREAKEWIHTCQFLLNSVLPEPVVLLTSEISNILAVRDDPKTEEDQREDGAASEERRDSEKRVASPAAKKERKVFSRKSAKKDGAQSPGSETLKEPTDETDGTELKAKASMQLPTRMEVIGGDENVQLAPILPQHPVPVSPTSEIELSPPNSSLTKSAFDAIANMDSIQGQLLVTEKRAQDAEQKVFDLEEGLDRSNEKIRALEKTISQLSNNLNEEETPKADETPKPQEPVPEQKPQALNESSKRSSSRAYSGTKKKGKKKQ